ncbi:hypothetical protein [Sporosarcina saromensis]|nr:hypothetical protein [Sporosarcina saromensis]
MRIIINALVGMLKMAINHILETDKTIYKWMKRMTTNEFSPIIDKYSPC